MLMGLSRQWLPWKICRKEVTLVNNHSVIYSIIVDNDFIRFKWYLWYEIQKEYSSLFLLIIV